MKMCKVRKKSRSMNNLLLMCSSSNRSLLVSAATDSARKRPESLKSAAKGTVSKENVGGLFLEICSMDCVTYPRLSVRHFWADLMAIRFRWWNAFHSCPRAQSTDSTRPKKAPIAAKMNWPQCGAKLLDVLALFHILSNRHRRILRSMR